MIASEGLIISVSKKIALIVQQKRSQLVSNWKKLNNSKSRGKSKANLVLGMKNKGSWFAFVMDSTIDFKSFCILNFVVKILFEDPKKDKKLDILYFLNAQTHNSRLTTKLIYGLDL